MSYTYKPCKICRKDVRIDTSTDVNYSGQLILPCGIFCSESCYEFYLGE